MAKEGDKGPCLAAQLLEDTFENHVTHEVLGMCSPFAKCAIVLRSHWEKFDSEDRMYAN